MKRAFVLLALLALAAPGAHAAVVHPHAHAKTTHVALSSRAKRLASRRLETRVTANEVQWIGYLFGVAPELASARRPHHVGPIRTSPSDPASSDTTAADDSSVSVDSSAAIDASNAAIQASNDQAAQDASIAAAEQQNEAAQAAATQTEINANNN